MSDSSKKINLITRAFEGASVRVLIDDSGEPWFVASDVARLLGYLDPDAATRAHCKASTTCPDDSSGQVRHIRVIPERDVYRLVMRSRLPSAERFEEWVVGEVLPSLRKTGRYGAADPMAVLDDPAAMRGLLLSYTEKVLALEARVSEAAPKVAIYDRIVESADTVGFREAAKLIRAATGANEHEVRGLMRRKGWIQRLARSLAPAHYGETTGYVTTRERQYTAPDGSSRVTPELRITQKGIARAIELLLAEERAA